MISATHHSDRDIARDQEHDKHGPFSHIFALIFFSLFYTAFFSPVFLGGGSFSSGDSLLYHYPAVMRGWTIWSDTLMSGYPIFADSQAMTWYPLRLFSSAVGFEVFAASAYVLAAFFTFGLAQLITGSTAAGLLAAVCYSMSGFMMAHLGHTAIIHAAAWIPLVLWSIRRLYLDVDWLWIGIGSIGVCCLFLSGHPQIFVNGLIIALTYGLFLNFRLPRQQSRRQLIAAYLAVLTAGIGLCAIQILPLAEIAPLSLRAEVTPAFFSSFSMTLAEWPILAFPNIFGGFAFGWPTYFGPGSGLVEVSCYCGLSIIMLIAIAWTSSNQRSEVIFWTVVAVTAFIYGFGHHTPLGTIAFHVPILNKFRTPARMYVVLTMAASMLAAIGFAELIRGTLHRQRITTALVISGIIVSSALAGVYFYYPAITTMAAAANIHLAPFASNPAVLGPILCALALAVTVAFAPQLKRAILGPVIFAIVVVDVGSFGWFGYWRLGTVDTTTWEEPIWSTLEQDLRLDGRLLSLTGINGSVTPATPNINQLFRLPSTTIYTPLTLARYANATGMSPYASMDISKYPALLDLLDVKWIAASGVGSDQPPMLLGTACGQSFSGEVQAVLPAEIPVTSIEVTSSLGCSQDVEDNVDVLSLELLDSSNTSQGTVFLKAGRDTSEWAIDDPLLKNTIKHQRAPISRRLPTGRFDAYQYRAVLPLRPDAKDKTFATARIRLKANSPIVNVLSIVLVNDTTGKRVPVPFWRFQLSGVGWEKGIATKTGVELVRRKVQGPGAAWLVQNVRRDTSEAVASTVRTGAFPSGEPFKVTSTALLETEAPPELLTTLGTGSVTVVDRKPGFWQLSLETDRPGFMVLSQSDYPGWQASVNGVNTKIYSTDYILQGIVVPSGKSLVEFKFKSMSLWWGAVISSIFAILTLLMMGRGLRRRTQCGH